MVSPVFAIAEGLEYGLFAAQIKRSEDSPGDYSKPLAQMLQGYQALNGFAARALEAASLPQVSWGGRFVVYLTPILLAVFKDSAYVPEQIQPILTCFHEHIGTLYHLVCIASSVTLLFYGQTLFAIPSLCVLGIELMDRNGWLPLTPSQFLHQSTPILLIVASAIAGGVFERMLAISDGFSLLAKTYSLNTKAASETFAIQRNLTPALVRDFFEGKLQLKLNPKFIHYTPPRESEKPEATETASPEKRADLFKDKVFDYLQEERTSVVRGCYDPLSETFPFPSNIANLGLNADNFLLRRCNEFGLRKKATDDDAGISTALLELLKWISPLPQLEEAINQGFWEWCTLDQQTETLLAAIGARQLSKDEFYAFWQGWIEGQAVDEEAKAALRGELAHRELCGYQIEEIDGQIRPDFVRLMLLDMGIAEIEPMDPTSSIESDQDD